MKERPVVPQAEMLRQQEFMKLVNSLDGRPHSYHIVSMGCQMNERDSESIAGMLEKMGMVHAPVREDADLILYMRDGDVLAVLDIDSRVLASFDEEDAAGLEAVAASLAELF